MIKKYLLGLVLGLMIIPQMGNAQTASELQRMINELISRLEQIRNNSNTNNNAFFKLESPNNGGTWRPGDSMRVEWSYNTAEFTGQDVLVVLSPVNLSNSNPEIIIARTTNQTNFIDIAIGDHLSKQDYNIRVCANKNSGGSSCDTTDHFIRIAHSLNASKRPDLSVMSFGLNDTGPFVTFCNNGLTNVSRFPLVISIDGVEREFEMSAYRQANTQCGTRHQWEYATWGLNNRKNHTGYAEVDPENDYREANENNNKLTSSFRQNNVEAISFSSPLARDNWQAGDRTRVQWKNNTNEISRSTKINIRLLTANHRLASGFTPIDTKNDGSEYVDVSEVPPGDYYFQITGRSSNLTPDYFSFDSGVFSISNWEVSGGNSAPQILRVNGPVDYQGREISEIYNGPIRVNQYAEWEFEAEDEDGDSLVWSVNYGDGSYYSDRSCQNPSSSNAPYIASHYWGSPGNYRMAVTANDCQGGTDTFGLTVIVN